jgi:hypothetical protein
VARLLQAIALRHPDLFDRLVLACPPRIDLGPVEMPEITVELIRAMLMDGFGPKIKQQDPDLVARLIDEHHPRRT